MKSSINTTGNTIGLYVAGILLTAGLLAGCSGLRPYPNTLAKNLHIRTEADSGTIFQKVRVAVDIFGVASDCTTEYRGTVKLKGGSIKVGIPPGELSYMVFVFSNSSLLAGSRSSMSHETLLKTRAGYDYDIKVSYRDDIYSVTIEETHSRRSKRREIELRDLSACTSL
jgi:hypothetical protein